MRYMFFFMLCMSMYLTAAGLYRFGSTSKEMSPAAYFYTYCYKSSLYYDGRSSNDVVACCLNAISLNLITDDLCNPEVIKWKNHSGKTLLHYAAEFQRPTIAAFLLAMGASPFAQDMYGNTPLHNACIFPQRDVDEQFVAFTQGRPIPASIVINLKRILNSIDRTYFDHVKNKKDFKESSCMILPLLMEYSDWLLKNKSGMSFILYMNTPLLQEMLCTVFEIVSNEKYRLNEQAVSTKLLYWQEVRDAMVKELIDRKKKEKSKGRVFVEDL